jgi:sulfite exporter TauE/SafE
VASARSRWLADVALYTFGGVVSSVLVGAALGALGGLLPAPVTAHGGTIVLAVAVLAVAREVGVLRFPLPQPRRQTRDLWSKTFPAPVAALLWGFDLGLTLTTRFTFAGTWVLLLMPVLTANPAVGAAVLLAHWLGRALPVWLSPLLMSSPTSTLRVYDAIDARERIFRSTQVLGLAMLIAFWLIQL